MQRLIDFSRSQGKEVVQIELPTIEYSLPAYYVIAMSEASSNLSRMDGIRFGHGREKFGKEVKERILLGAFSLSAGYSDAFFEKAARIRRKLSKEVQQAFSLCDVILSPVTLIPPSKLDENEVDPVAEIQTDQMTVLANLVGVPSLAIPLKREDPALPSSVQIMAPRGYDLRCLEWGEFYASL
jgi:aspartyl-tRNA(Asn)/glutamyl-tRNA(Gln) amidotransferase subunit A